MKQIERYKEFAEENGYNENLALRDYSYDNWCYVEEFKNTLVKVEDWYNTYFSIKDIITSKPFIEAVARGLIEMANKNNFVWSGWNWMIDFWDGVFLDVQYHIDNNAEAILIDELTSIQAIAIRDWRLEKFIESLLLIK